MDPHAHHAPGALGSRSMHPGSCRFTPAASSKLSVTVWCCATATTTTLDTFDGTQTQQYAPQGSFDLGNVLHHEMESIHLVGLVHLHLLEHMVEVLEVAVLEAGAAGIGGASAHAHTHRMATGDFIAATSISTSLVASRPWSPKDTPFTTSWRRLRSIVRLYKRATSINIRVGSPAVTSMRP